VEKITHMLLSSAHSAHSAGSLPLSLLFLRLTSLMSSSSDQDAGRVPVKALPHRETCCSLSISDQEAGRGPTSLFVCARIFVSDGCFLQAIGKFPPRRLLSRYLRERPRETGPVVMLLNGWGGRRRRAATGKSVDLLREQGTHRSSVSLRIPRLDHSLGRDPVKLFDFRFRTSRCSRCCNTLGRGPWMLMLARSLHE